MLPEQSSFFHAVVRPNKKRLASTEFNARAEFSHGSLENNDIDIKKQAIAATVHDQLEDLCVNNHQHAVHSNKGLLSHDSDILKHNDGSAEKQAFYLRIKDRLSAYKPGFKQSATGNHIVSRFTTSEPVFPTVICHPPAPFIDIVNDMKQNETDYTLLEKYFISWKCQYPTTLLFIQCGYRFRVFGDDAILAAPILGLAAYPHRHFMTCGIPIFRLDFHIRRLLSSSHSTLYDIGVIRQMDDAALKATSGPFERQLTERYTAATWVDNVKFNDTADTSRSMGSSSSHVIVSVFESHSPPLIHVVSLDLLSSDWVCSIFPSSLNHLTNVIHHFSPSHLLFPDVSSYSFFGSTLQRLLSYTTKEKMASPFFDLSIDTKRFRCSIARHEMGPFLSNIPSSFRMDECALVHEEFITQSLSQLCSYLADLSIDPVPLMINATLHSIHLNNRHNEKQCSMDTDRQEKRWMYISNTALFYLEVLDSPTRSLFDSLSEKIQTPMGKRLLKRWLHSPSIDKMTILSRQDVIEYFLINAQSCHLKEKNSFKKLPVLRGMDFERGLARWRMKRIQMNEFRWLLKEMKSAVDAIHVYFTGKKEYGLPLLLKIHMDSIVSGGMVVDSLLGMITDSAASENHELVGKESPKMSKFRKKSGKNASMPSISNHHECAFNLSSNFMLDRINVDSEDAHDIQRSIVLLRQYQHKINRIYHQLELHRQDIMSTGVLSSPHLIKYKSVGVEDYLFELPKGVKAPFDWLTINATNTHQRYRSPRVSVLMHDVARLKALIKRSSHHLLQCLLLTLIKCGDWQRLKSMTESIAHLDVFIGLSMHALDGQHCRPIIHEQSSHSPNDCQKKLFFKESRHPVLIKHNQGKEIVSNDLSLLNGRERCLFVTGPNMGGKSCYAKQLALLTIMTQIGAWVPALEAEVSLFDAVYCSALKESELLARQSSFLTELLQVSEMMERGTCCSLVLLDELGRGTSTHDGWAIAYAVLHELLLRHMFILFVTHMPSLSNVDSMTNDALQLRYMSYRVHRTEESPLCEKDIIFLYKAVRGIAPQSYGWHCARMAHLPTEVLERALSLSKQLTTKEKKLPLTKLSIEELTRFKSLIHRFSV